MAITTTQGEEISQAITELEDVAPSMSEEAFQGPGLTAHNSGSGTQYNAQGEYIAQGEARQYISGGGPMHLGKD